MSNVRPFVDVLGRSQEATDNDLLLSAGALVKQSIASGQAWTIPSGYSMVVAGPIANSGTLSISGRLVIQ